MADIRIEENKYPDSEDTIIEVIGVDPKEDDILGLIHGLLEKKKELSLVERFLEQKNQK